MGLKINTLRADHEGEYFLNEFKYYKHSGIRYKITIRYTLQQKRMFGFVRFVYPQTVRRRVNSLTRMTTFLILNYF